MMASFSDSIQKAQTISTCQFCEESSIKWKCINCNLLLCQLCNSRIHSKLTIANEHHVINLEDCGTEDAVETSRRVDLEKLTCTLHSDQKCVLYCKDCERSVCLDCLIEGHQNHKCNKLDEVYNEKLKDIKDMKQKFESDISHFNEKEKDLQQILTEGNKQYFENRQKVLEIKDSVVKYADDLLLDLEQWKPTEDQINKEMDSMRERKDRLEKRKSQLDETLGSQSASEIFVTSNSLDKSMPDRTVRPVELKQRKFFPGKLSNQPISDLFGMVYDVPDFQFVQTYSGVPIMENLLQYKLMMCDDYSAFIGDMSVLQKIILEKDKITIKRRVELPVYDMAMMNNEDLLISSKEQDLKLYTKDGQIKTFKSFAPLYTLGVHINKQYEIFVGLSGDSGNSILGKNVGKILQINQKGDIVHTYEYYTDNQSLFTMPHRICTNNQNIYVIDHKLDDRLRSVVVIDKIGQLQWTFNSSFDRFYPSDIAVTSTDMVIVTDWYNDALHVLSPTGELIVCKVVTDIGISLPYSLSIDKDNKLWIGTCYYENIYALKLT